MQHTTPGVAAALLGLLARVFDVKANVVAQFGPDSQEMSLIGFKRKSEYKRPVRPKQDA